jgi:hypothetical protein
MAELPGGAQSWRGRGGEMGGEVVGAHLMRRAAQQPVDLRVATGVRGPQPVCGPRRDPTEAG